MDKFLTADEVLRCAEAHLIDGVEQQVIAKLMNVNIGRVNEACTAVEYARNHVMDIVDVARGRKKIVKDA